MEGFKKFLLSKGIGKDTVSSKCARINRIKSEYDIELEYSNDRCEELIESLTYTAADAKRGLLPDSRITIRGNYVTGLASLRTALKDYIEYLDSIVVVKKKKSTKCFFEGDSKDFVSYIGPKCRNAIQALTKSARAATGACECCGAKKTLQAAHQNGKERNDIIKEILERKYKISSDYYKVDLDEFIDEFKKSHLPLDDAFYFLCGDCHKEYDSKDAAKILAVDTAVKASRAAKAKI